MSRRCGTGSPTACRSVLLWPSLPGGTPATIASNWSTTMSWHSPPHVGVQRTIDWDAVVPNMVYVWTGLTQAIGLKYYGIPGIDVPPDTGFQYREPKQQEAFMQPEEYDALIEDPTGYLLNVWLPRVAAPVQTPGSPTTQENHLSFLKGGMAMLQYFTAFGTQNARLRARIGNCSRHGRNLQGTDGYSGGQAARLSRTGGRSIRATRQGGGRLRGADAAFVSRCADDFRSESRSSDRLSGCIEAACRSFLPKMFQNIYWATLKPIIQELWSHGRQTLFYAEGYWNHHLESFNELPEQSIVYHVDQGDLFKAHRVLGERFCISGGLPNLLLAEGSPEEVRDYCRKMIDGVAGDGGYIMDASAIVQNDAQVDNMQAMTDFTREYGVYSSGSSSSLPEVCLPDPSLSGDPRLHPDPQQSCRAPGVCLPWRDQRKQIDSITGDEALCQRVWEDIDGLAYAYVWQVLLSF